MPCRSTRSQGKKKIQKSSSNAPNMRHMAGKLLGHGEYFRQQKEHMSFLGCLKTARLTGVGWRFFIMFSAT